MRFLGKPTFFVTPLVTPGGLRCLLAASAAADTAARSALAMLQNRYVISRRFRVVTESDLHW